MEVQIPYNSRKEPSKKLDAASGITLETLLENHTQCCFLLVRKARLCNLGRVPGMLYCGTHISEAQIHLQTCLNEQPQSAPSGSDDTSGILLLPTLPSSSTPSIRQLKRGRNDKNLSSDRVPCPIDPSHT